MELNWGEIYPRILVGRQLKNLSKEESSKLINFSSMKSLRAAMSQIEEFKPDLALINYNHPIHFFHLADLLRTAKCRRIIIAHNILPHERFFAAPDAIKNLARLADKVVVHASSEIGVAALRQLVPVTKLLQLKLPVLTPLNPSPSLTRSKKVLFFGMLRRYKGIEYLPKIADMLLDFNLSLHIIGEELISPIGNYFNKIKNKKYNDMYLNLLATKKNVRLDIGYMSDAQLFQEIDRSLLAIFPFKSATQSASLISALGRGTPAIANGVGGIKDVLENGVNGFISLNQSNFYEALAKGIKYPWNYKKVVQSIESHNYESYIEALLTA